MPTRQGLRFAIRTQYSTRFHMLLIVAASVSVAVLITHALLSIGVSTIWHRWIWSLVFAYITFFAGVWVWLHLSRYGRHMRNRWDGDFSGPDLSGGGSGGGSTGGPSSSGIDAGGGSFDGGGADASWGDAEIPLHSDLPLDSVGDTLSNADLPIADVGEGGCLLVIAGVLLALVLAGLFGAAGLVILDAPNILAEVVFEVLLASTLIRGVRRLQGRDWAQVLFRRTWKAFAILSVVALVFAFFAGIVAPKARTTMDVIHALRGK